MNIFKIIIIIFICLFTQQKAYSQISVPADYVILQDHYSGKILYEKDADSKIYPASLTKIMTSIVTFDLLKKYNAPKVIDYLSIDTEGSEYEILNDIDFNSLNIKEILFEYKHFDGY